MDIALHFSGLPACAVQYCNSVTVLEPWVVPCILAVLQYFSTTYLAAKVQLATFSLTLTLADSSGPFELGQRGQV